jgi:methionine-gamma-lyase
MMGFGYDPMLSEGSLKPPQFSTSTFVFRSAEDGKKFFATIQGRRKLGPDEEPGLVYSRFNNPNLEVLEDRLAIWDEAEASLAFASGMAAISTTLWAYLRPGDIILQSQPIYGGTETLIQSILPEFGVSQVGFEVEQGTDAMHAAAEVARKKGKVAAIFLETPANPTNGLVDIAAARKVSESLARDGVRPPVIVDNTMLGPIFSTPIAHGADIVVTSLTKYVGGHSDLIAGGASGTRAWLAPVRRMRSTLGTMCDPHTAWLLMRSLETLKLRMEAGAAGWQSSCAAIPRSRMSGSWTFCRRITPIARCTCGRTSHRAPPFPSRSAAARRPPSACSTGCRSSSWR